MPQNCGEIPFYSNISIFNRGIQIKNSLIPVGSKNVDKDISYNFAEYTWRGTFDSGTILGEATCLGQAEGGWPNVLNPGSVVNNNGNRLDSSIPKGFGKGQFCWCRMTHPGFSSWVYASNHNAAGACVAECAKSCTSVLTDDRFIKSLFYNIGK
mgnify:CR=1 FL=1